MTEVIKTVASIQFDRLKASLVNLGATVQISPSLEVNGRIHYDKKLILINEPTAIGGVLTLAHEGGHYLHFLRNPLLETKCSTALREKQAYLFGWYLLKKTRIPNLVITKKQWRDWHEVDQIS